MRRLVTTTIACVSAAFTASSAVAQASTPAPPTLLVGRAVRDITPRTEWLPLPAVARTSMVGIIDPIHVRVIAVGDGATPSLMVTFEMSGVPPVDTFLTGLSEHTGVPVDAIFFGATHCHSAPRAEPVPDVPSTALYSRFVYGQMMDAADEAIADMRPASVGIGYSESYVNVNRQGTFTRPDGTTYGTQGYNPTGASDKTLAVVRFQDPDGKPLAFIVNYAVHNTIMYANRFREAGVGVSSDLGGFVSSALEKRFDGSVAIWLPGASGDQNPILSNEYFTPSTTTGEQEVHFFRSAAHELVELWGKIQFADVLRALAGIDSLRSAAKVGYAFGGSTIPASEEGDPPFTLTLKVLRIGDIAFVGNPGEMFNSIGVYMKRRSLVPNTMIVNHCRTFTKQYEQFRTYMPDDHAMITGGFHGTPRLYRIGTVNEGFTKLMNELLLTSGRR